jgi:hypothetical protein
VSENEAKLFYDQQKDEHRLALIALADETQGKAAIARLNSGAKFADVAREMSIDPGARSRRRDPGWVSYGQLPSRSRRTRAAQAGEHTTRSPSRRHYVFSLLETRPRKNRRRSTRTRPTSSRCSRTEEGRAGLAVPGRPQEAVRLKLEGRVGRGRREGPRAPDSLARWLVTDPNAPA